MDQVEKIKNKILETLTDAEIHILDPRNDGIHLEAIVISDTFLTLPLFKQHQIVMNSLKDFFETTLHALALKTYTKEQWEKKNDRNI
ncbi:MAG: BolA/IbaG family iron-sulfur metabolism protein [Simkaniaceae bacterium]|nr:BolA/IbaG family iron-sulfur metabolism protein [Simkaniaceae bacterium]